MSFLFFVLFPVRSRCVFFSCHRIISHDKIYVEQKENIGVQNLPTSSVTLIWPITELYSGQILSTDFDEQRALEPFYADTK